MGSQANETVTGAPVAIIGFIPRRGEDPRLVPAAYLDWALEGPPAIRKPLRVTVATKLFASGNPSPPMQLGGYAGFQQIIATKEFRVAICIRDVSVTWHKNTDRVDFKRSVEILEGYTPDNKWTYTPPNQWQHLNKGYHKGVSKVRSKVTTDVDNVTLWVSARVKLWWVYDLGQFLITGHYAPWAIVTVKYTIKRTGQIEVMLKGSRIPSQHLYVNWARHALHDMDGNSLSEVRGFMERGKCVDADTFVVARYP